MPRYFYLSAYPQLVLITFLGSLILFTTLGLLADVTWWIAPSTIAFLHVLFLVSRFGVVRIHTTADPIRLTTRDLYRSCALTPPLRATSWWSYDFDDVAPDKRTGSRSNDINVVLRLTDSQRNVLCFVERITFDTRFPNDVPYMDQGTTSCGTFILVQRVDRLTGFLRQHLPGPDFLEMNDNTNGREQPE